MRSGVFVSPIKPANLSNADNRKINRIIGIEICGNIKTKTTIPHKIAKSGDIRNKIMNPSGMYILTLSYPY